MASIRAFGGAPWFSFANTVVMYRIAFSPLTDTSNETRSNRQRHGEGSKPQVRRYIIGVCAPLAQLDRASGYEPGGRRFESCRARQILIRGVSPRGPLDWFARGPRD